MRISIIGPGIMPIPPKGWGAVEALIWDYKINLERRGIDVQIVNSSDVVQVLDEVREFKPDVVHVQYDDYACFLKHIKAPVKIATSHFGYLEHPDRYIRSRKRFKYLGYQIKNVVRWVSGMPLRSAGRLSYYYSFRDFLDGEFYIFCLSEGIKQTYKSFGVAERRLYVQKNGAREDLFRYTQQPTKADRSICLAKIDKRKRQHFYQDIASVDFVGNRSSSRFDYQRENYLGEWSKETLYQNLTEYANLVLLSDGEADPLVTKEAMMAGLGLVVSTWATANLDLTLPFIDVIPEGRMNDVPYIEKVIAENREKALAHRASIREYALRNFSWNVVIEDYVRLIQSLLRSV